MGGRAGPTPSLLNPKRGAHCHPLAPMDTIHQPPPSSERKKWHRGVGQQDVWWGVLSPERSCVVLVVHVVVIITVVT